MTRGSERTQSHQSQAGSRNSTKPRARNAKKPRNSGALCTTRNTGYSTMICVGCDPFATATAQVGSAPEGNGVFCTCFNVPF
jgi:hypothetical protein